MDKQKFIDKYNNADDKIKPYLKQSYASAKRQYETMKAMAEAYDEIKDN